MDPGFSLHLMWFFSIRINKRKEPGNSLKQNVVFLLAEFFPLTKTSGCQLDWSFWLTKFGKTSFWLTKPSLSYCQDQFLANQIWQCYLRCPSLQLPRGIWCMLLPRVGINRRRMLPARMLCTLYVRSRRLIQNGGSI
jgi:hypothetical protein